MPVVDMYGSAYVYAFEEAALDQSNEDYLTVFQDLLPHGPAWTRRPGAWLTRLLRGLAREASRVELTAAQLIEETDYRETQLLLPEWEAFAGLPDCGQVSDDISERQAALHAKLTQNISPTPSTFQSIAEGLGYTGVVVTRTEANPFTVGSTVGDTLRGGPWRHAWSITTNESTDNDALLRCLVNQLAPQHGIVIFNLGTVGI